MAERGRFPCMPPTKTFDARRGGKKGSFADRSDGLLSQFTDPAAGDARKWRESFGYERRPEKMKRGKPFIARAVPRSSSGS